MKLLHVSPQEYDQMYPNGWLNVNVELDIAWPHCPRSVTPAHACKVISEIFKEISQMILKGIDWFRAYVLIRYVIQYLFKLGKLFIHFRFLKPRVNTLDTPVRRHVCCRLMHSWQLPSVTSQCGVNNLTTWHNSTWHGNRVAVSPQKTVLWSPITVHSNCWCPGFVRL